jgi:hypothetical protein
LQTRNSFELDLSGISDAEDLLSEFTTSNVRRPSHVIETSPHSMSESNYAKLLQIDSDQSTPKIKAIREELDQSKTRFRQSINDLLNSSPISVAQLIRLMFCRLHHWKKHPTLRIW